MKFGVITFPGSNCDQDLIYVLKNIMKQDVVNLWHKDTDLQKVDVVFLPGGFSYGDYLRSGAIASLSPIMTEVIKFAKKGGIVIGICNGFQILCESKLLPGALLHNNNRRFICKNVYLKVENNKTIFTSECEAGQVLKVPIAHGEGRYYADEKTLRELHKNKQIIFRYCDKDGDVIEESNPNGTMENIAGISNKEGNVFGMMPHPERCADENLSNVDGQLLFASLIKNLLKKTKSTKGKTVKTTTEAKPAVKKTSSKTTAKSTPVKKAKVADTKKSDTKKTTATKKATTAPKATASKAVKATVAKTKTPVAKKSPAAAKKTIAKKK